MTHLGPEDDGVSCAICGRELKSLEQIRDAMALGPTEALSYGRVGNPKDAYSVALSYLTQVAAESVRDLACHSGACYEGMI